MELLVTICVKYKSGSTQYSHVHVTTYKHVAPQLLLFCVCVKQEQFSLWL